MPSLHKLLPTYDMCYQVAREWMLTKWIHGPCGSTQCPTSSEQKVYLEQSCKNMAGYLHLSLPKQEPSTCLGSLVSETAESWWHDESFCPNQFTLFASAHGFWELTTDGLYSEDLFGEQNTAFTKPLHADSVSLPTAPIFSAPINITPNNALKCDLLWGDWEDTILGMRAHKLCGWWTAQLETAWPTRLHTLLVLTWHRHCFPVQQTQQMENIANIYCWVRGPL